MNKEVALFAVLTLSAILLLSVAPGSNERGNYLVTQEKAEAF